MKHIVLIFIIQTSSLILCPAQDSPCNQGRAIPPRVDPRNQYLICLPEVARTSGFSSPPVVVGDLNHDGIEDWACSAPRKDTSVFGGYPHMIVLYYGQQGRLPDASEGVPLKTTEKNGTTELIACGDWDGDGNRDLCVGVELMGDTSYGNSAGWDLAQNVVFWGNSSGTYSDNDTTWLPPPNGQAWNAIAYGISMDFDHDSVDDLVYTSFGAFANGGWVPVPGMHFYRGHKGERWGHNGIIRQADQVWWNRPGLSELGAADQDNDGNTDIVFYSYANGSGTAPLSILYGRPNSLPDTTEVETVSLASSNGRSCLFSDVTGDGVPELLVHAGTEEQIKVYIGLKGQRLKEQYGSGNDSEHIGQTKWWGKPWARVWLPKKINDFWDISIDKLINLKDGDMDGVDDIWVYAYPYLFCYHTGEHLDSLADGAIRIETGLDYRSFRVTNIDGSHREMIMVNSGSGFILALPSKEIPGEYAFPRKLPEGTGKPTNAVEEKPGATGGGKMELSQRK